jgi:hypothetical protein
VSRMDCQHECEILDAVASGRWPDRVDSELREHASACVICSDAALIATLYRDDCERALEQVRVPSAGLVWWKAELRARREAIRVASRPIAWVCAIACVCAAAAFLLVLHSLSVPLDMSSISAFVLSQPWVIWLLLGAIVALTPIALYFVYSDE